MEILFILIPMAIVLLGIAIFAFFWAVNNKQFDDLDSPAYIVLLDDKIDHGKSDKDEGEKLK